MHYGHMIVVNMLMITIKQKEDYKKHMIIYSLHVRHSNKTLHEEAHQLTQLAPI